MQRGSGSVAAGFPEPGEFAGLRSDFERYALSRADAAFLLGRSQLPRQLHRSPPRDRPLPLLRGAIADIRARIIRAAVPEWREAGIWFCGPAGFGEALRNDFDAQGVPVAERFHQELFAMR